MICISVVTLCFLNLLLSASCNNCGANFKQFQDVCAYIQMNQMLSYCEAQKSCATNGGQLVSNLDNLVSILLNEKTKKIGKSFFIGLILSDNHLLLNRYTGERITVSNHSQNKTCPVYTFVSEKKELIAFSDCQEKNYYICEKSDSIISEEFTFYKLPSVENSLSNYHNEQHCSIVTKLYVPRHCSHRCNERSWCQAYWYNKDGECHLSSLSNVFPNLASSANWKYYSMNPKLKNVTSCWTTFVRRISKAVNFKRHWEEYKAGFGDSNGSFWLGLEQMHSLTRNKPTTSRVYFIDWDDSFYYSENSIFQIADESTSYTLLASNDRGNIFGSLTCSNAIPFSTIERDNDRWAGVNCVASYGDGGWWNHACHGGTLTGKYYNEDEVNAGKVQHGTGVYFLFMNGKEHDHSSAKFAEGKFRKDSFC